ncbi:MAG: hypothetical protein IJ026_01930 [Candidatus Methanomethylophilaceae archaeon]|nr:hypothetical protein [Candidatus Methanomethylophilaceae archaeon]
MSRTGTRFVLDTCVLRDDAFIEWLGPLCRNGLKTSAVSYMEHRRQLIGGPKGVRHLEDMLRRWGIEVIPFDKNSAERASDLMAERPSVCPMCNKLDWADTMIYSTDGKSSLLVTYNVSDYPVTRTVSSARTRSSGCSPGTGVRKGNLPPVHPPSMATGLFHGIIRTTGHGLTVMEVLYGFIMALIFVTAARMGILPYGDATDLVVLIVGMNLTWGAIDAVAFYLVDIFNQRRYLRLLDNTDGLDRDTRISMLMDEFGGTPLDVLDPGDERRVCSMILDMRTESRAEVVSDRRSMRDSALGCFLIVAMMTVPVVLPLLLIPDVDVALFTASAFSVTVLFFIGYHLHDYIGCSRWLSGLILTAIGWGITLVATLTGG